VTVTDPPPGSGEAWTFAITGGVVSGPSVWSIVNAWLPAGPASPAPFTALTYNRCAPSACSGTVALAASVHVPPASGSGLSTAYQYPAMPLVSTGAVHANDGAVSPLAPSTPSSTPVGASGGVASILNAWLAAAPTIPYPFSAATYSTCSPSPCGVSVTPVSVVRVPPVPGAGSSTAYQ